MKIFVASDHRGFDLKSAVIKHLAKLGYDVEDAGNDHIDPNDDFPIIAASAVSKVLSYRQPHYARAILICGSGQGMVMAANRFKGIRAGLGWSRQASKSIRKDEDSNVLAIPAELADKNQKLVFDIIEDFLSTPFAGATRYKRRNSELDNLVY